MNTKRILLVTIFSLGILLPSTTIAAGIQVTPEKLDFEVNKTQTKEIVVANPTADVQLFEIYPDDYDSSIKANPASFTLEAGARKKVLITVDSAKLVGVTSTNLSIVSKPLADSKIQVNAGVKIPINITTNNKLNILYSIGLGVLILAGAITTFFLLRKRKSKLNKIA